MIYKTLNSIGMLVVLSITLSASAQRKTLQEVSVDVGHERIFAFALSDDGKYLFTGNRKGIILDTSNGQVIQEFQPEKFFDYSIGMNCAAFSTDNKKIIIGDAIGFVIIYNVEKQEELYR